MVRIKYVGSFCNGNQDMLNDVGECRQFYGEVYYWYKANLLKFISTILFKDLTFEELFDRFRNLYLKERKKLESLDYPITVEFADGYFKQMVYDPIFAQLIDRVSEVDQERNYFMNYVKKRQWKITEQFREGVLEYGEVRIKEISSNHAEKLIPRSFVEKCHLKIV